MTMAISGIIGFAIALQPAWMGIPIFGAPQFDQTTLWWKIFAIVLSVLSFRGLGRVASGISQRNFAICHG